MSAATKRFYSIIGSLAFLIAAMVIYANFILPEYRAVQERRGEVEAHRVFVQNQKQVVDRVEELLNRYRSAQIEERLARILPPDQDAPEIFAQIRGMAQATSVSLDDISVKESAAASQGVAVRPREGLASDAIIKPLSTVSLEFQVSGDYEAVKSFLNVLETNIRIIDVGKISLGPRAEGEANVLSAKVTAVMYYQR